MWLRTNQCSFSISLSSYLWRNNETTCAGRSANVYRIVRHSGAFDWASKSARGSSSQPTRLLVSWSLRTSGRSAALFGRHKNIDTYRGVSIIKIPAGSLRAKSELYQREAEVQSTQWTPKIWEHRTSSRRILYILRHRFLPECDRTLSYHNRTLFPFSPFFVVWDMKVGFNWKFLLD